MARGLGLHGCDRLLCCIVQVGRCDDGHAAVLHDLLPHLHVRSLQPHHQGNLQVELLRGRDDSRGDDVALHDAAEDVDEDGLDVVVHGEDLEGLDDLLLLGGAPDVEEVRGGA